LERIDLRFLEPPARTMVMQMLSAVADFPNVHMNLIHCQNMGHGQWQYFVGQKNQGAAAFPQYSRLPFQLFPMLVTHEIMEANRAPGFSEGAMCFTVAALTGIERTKVRVMLNSSKSWQKSFGGTGLKSCAEVNENR
jgi:hypothetical protein